MLRMIIANHKMVVDGVRGWTTIRTQLRENLVILGESNFSMTLLSTDVCTSPACTGYRDVFILLLQLWPDSCLVFWLVCPLSAYGG